MHVESPDPLRAGMFGMESKEKDMSSIPNTQEELLFSSKLQKESARLAKEGGRVGKESRR
jgi:hypothetical protein